MSNQIIKLLLVLRRNKLFNGPFFKDPGQTEGQPSTQDETDHGVEKPSLCSKEVTSYEFNRTARNGSHNYLQELDNDIDEWRIGSEGRDHFFQSMGIKKDMIESYRFSP